MSVNFFETYQKQIESQVNKPGGINFEQIISDAIEKKFSSMFPNLVNDNKDEPDDNQDDNQEKDDINKGESDNNENNNEE